MGDFVAGMIGVRDKAMESVAPNRGKPVASEPVLPELRKLAPDDLVLISTYLSRRYEVDAVVRTTTAQRIVAMVAQKTGATKPGRQRFPREHHAAASRHRKLQINLRHRPHGEKTKRGGIRRSHGKVRL